MLYTFAIFLWRKDKLCSVVRSLCRDDPSKISLSCPYILTRLLYESLRWGSLPLFNFPVGSIFLAIASASRPWFLFGQLNPFFRPRNMSSSRPFQCHAVPWSSDSLSEAPNVSYNFQSRLSFSFILLLLRPRSSLPLPYSYALTFTSSFLPGSFPT